MEQPAIRGADRFNGGLHRRRFVQDGDIPVTVLRREPGHEAQPHRSVTAAVPAPSTSRLQRTESALAAETAGRERAERQLIEAQAVARDLQTKIGHYELAKNEAIDALRHEREALAALRTELEALTAQLHEADDRVASAEHLADEAQALLADERTARKNLEKSLRAVELARDAAKQRSADLSAQLAETVRPEPPIRRRPVAEPVAVVPVKRGRPPAVRAPEPEQEPVKWWLSPAKPGAKRA
jgi:paraquat-inducible protein B